MGHVRDSRYAARSQHDVLRLLATQPFAWLVSAGGEDAAFTPLPLRAECDAQGRLVALRGHLARRNPHVARLRRDGRAQALVMGPHAYVSPSWLDDRTQAPSWNYAGAMFDLDMVVSEEEDDIRAELDALVTQMEGGRPRAWALAEMGERYARLAAGVSSLRGVVREVRATFKLGQDEAPHDLAQLLAGLQAGGEQALVEWMRDFAGDAGDRP
ncbi:FMN-binding negative transcriptional regulator [Stenotrophomonas tumulicola]|uniref:FMN-binding negative transcriptional regulator n=1 Tax=Stenotrophomonas tumulicola TaxID=1685415 RepID=A0A7W3FM65_9GAMM|nr:FMN-binding negative transcriptional regulator [Stenotrophomonas tumulicola]MBA8682104.1 FMN-binding negative transcriptional regulator [Stenotrophomonas tumulicola]